MGILERLLGRKAKTSANISGEIDAQLAEIEKSRTAIAKAQAARDVAIDDFDDEAHRAADEAIAAGKRDIERRERAVAKLRAAHDEAVDRETRAALHREAAAAAKEDEALAARIQLEYVPAATKLAEFVEALELSADRRSALQERARQMGEPLTLQDPEAFRGVSPRRWSVTFPNPEEDGVIQTSVDQAPFGMVRWVDGGLYQIEKA